MSSNHKPPAIALFGQSADHSFVPAGVRTAIARSGDPEPALGRWRVV